MRCGIKYPEMGVIHSQKCPVKEGLARTLKKGPVKEGLAEERLKTELSHWLRKGLKQSFLTDSGKAQSSEMVRGELQSKKSLLILLETPIRKKQ
jgi:hypothetical protein